MTFDMGTVGGMNVQVFTDANYPSIAADRGSETEGLVMCGDPCVSWITRTQKCADTWPSQT